MGAVVVLAEWRQLHPGRHAQQAASEPQRRAPVWPWEWWLALWGGW